MSLSPVIIFTYKRHKSLTQTIEALKKNALAGNTDLFIFSDGAKNDNDQVMVNNVRTYLKSITGFKSITIKESANNKGLANSIIDGVTETLIKYDRVIVLEDDLITTPNFLIFMNKGLEFYKDRQAVFSISGYSFNLGIKKNTTTDAYFLNRGWSWGWATWKSRWKDVDWNVSDYQSFNLDKNARSAFSKGGSDLNKMLDKQMSGKLDSWAIRWFYHQFKKQGLTLYPALSKIFNNGFDAVATHTNGSSKRYLPVLDNTEKENFLLPDEIKIDDYFQKQFSKKMGLGARLRSKIETVLTRAFM